MATIANNKDIEILGAICDISTLVFWIDWCECGYTQMLERHSERLF